MVVDFFLAQEVFSFSWMVYGRKEIRQNNKGYSSMLQTCCISSVKGGTVATERLNKLKTIGPAKVIAFIFTLFFSLCCFAHAEERPVSIVSQNQTVKPGTTVELDGSKSFDPEGREIQVWDWRQVGSILGGPVEVVLDKVAKPRFTLTRVGVYRFELRVSVVSDGNIITSEKSEVAVTVREPRIIKVPEDFPRLADAVREAEFLDTILIGKGIFNSEGIVINFGLTLKGAGKAQTILTGKDSHRVLEIESENLVSISNLGITEGRASRGAAILIAPNSHVEISQVRFVDNSAVSVEEGGGKGGAVYSGLGAKTTIRLSSFRFNYADFGSAVFGDTEGHLEIENSKFDRNLGTAIEAHKSTGSVTNCIFFKNEGSLSGAISIENSSYEIGNNSFVENSTLFINEEHSAGAIRLYSNSSADIWNNIFSKNPPKSLGYDDSSRVSVSYNDFWGNGDTELMDIMKAEDSDTASTGNMFVDPVFVGIYPYEDFFLSSKPRSPCIDAGADDGSCVEPDGSRCDLGFSGGEGFVADGNGSILEKIKENYSQFKTHIGNKDIEKLEELFEETEVETPIIITSEPTEDTSSSMSEEDMDALSRNEWKKTNAKVKDLIDSSYRVSYSGYPTNMTLSPSEKTAWVTETVSIISFDKELFGHHETWGLKRERFILSEDGNWLRKGNGSKLIVDWQIGVSKSKQGALNVFNLKASFTIKDYTGETVDISDVGEITLIMPDGEEVSNVIKDGDRHYIYKKLTEEPIIGLYTLKVVDKDRYEVLSSTRIHQAGNSTLFPEQPSVSVLDSEAGKTINWDLVDNTSSYTVRLIGKEDQKEAFQATVSNLDSFRKSISFILPPSLELDEKITYLAIVTANKNIRPFSSSVFSTPAKAVEYKAGAKGQTQEVTFRILDGLHGSSIEGAKVNILNSGISGITDGNGEFVVTLFEGEEYYMRYSANNYTPEVSVVSPGGSDDLVVSIKLTKLPADISALVPTVQPIGLILIGFTIVMFRHRFC